MQYLSPEGTPQQAAIQYIQLLRPVMMVPAKPYLPGKPHTVEPQAPTFTQSQVQTTSLPSPTASPQPQQHPWSPYGLYTRQSPMGSYSSQLTSYNPRPAMIQRPSYDLGLNMNEYVPSASAQVATVLAPRSSMMSSYSPYNYKPNKFQAMAQRA